MIETSSLNAKIVNYCTLKQRDRAGVTFAVASLVSGILVILASQGLLSNKVPATIGQKILLLGIGIGLLTVAGASFLFIYTQNSTDRSTHHVQTPASPQVVASPAELPVVVGVVPPPAAQPAVPQPASLPLSSPQGPPLSQPASFPSSPRMVPGAFQDLEWEQPQQSVYAQSFHSLTALTQEGLYLF